jgi:RimJ/RimL family protein N-acetyltransferase
MNTYKCLKQQSLSEKELSIVPLRDDDKFLIMKWRNDQMYHLRQNVKLTKKNQIDYFENIISKIFLMDKPTQLLFSYLENDACIGYGGLVNISWFDKRAEMSFLLNTELKSNQINYSNYLSTFINFIKKIIFKELDFNKLYTETYSFREQHIKILEDNDFIEEGVLKEHIFNQENKKFYNSIFHSILKNNYEE